MYEVGAILYGVFTLSQNDTKHKYAVVIERDEEGCLVTTFTTSQERSGSPIPVHGANPSIKEPQSYVFLSSVEIGIDPRTNIPFFFPRNTCIVPDYGFTKKTITEFESKVHDLVKVCQLYEHEVIDLFYTLYKCKRVPRWVKQLLERKLEELSAD